MFVREVVLSAPNYSNIFPEVNFIVLGAIVKSLFFLILLSVSVLFVYKSNTEFQLLNLYSATLLNLLKSRSLLVEIESFSLEHHVIY